MLIRDRSIMEKAMSITFEDICQKKISMDQQYEKRKSLLIDMGYKLVREYRKSLKLPNEFWKGDDGQDRQYVTVGHMNAKGLFEESPLAVLILDDDYHLEFIVSTVVDDNPLSGGPYYLLTIKIGYHDGRISVDIGKGMKALTVTSFKEDGAFSEVCATMKQIVLNAFTDTRLSD